jgi:hypothetical protein
MEELFVQNMDYEIQELLEDNKSHLSAALHERIATSHFLYNTLNIAVGRQRTGKSFSIIREIIKISNMSPHTHLLIYANKTGYPSDRTFEKLKVKIKIPIEYVAHDNLGDYIVTLLTYKDLYNEIYERQLEDQIIDEQKNALIEHLKITDFKRPFLHTLILLEDIAKAKIIKSEKSYIQELMTQCAHINCSFFLATQYWKSISTNIKSNVATILVFGGYSRQVFYYIFSQIPIEIDVKELWARYQGLGDHQKIIVNTITNDILIE